MKIDYHNMPNGASKTNFALRYIFNQVRTWYKFHLRYPWVKYNGFVRVMKGTSFAQHMDIKIGHNVQFGDYCNIACNVHFGNNILLAGKVSFVGKHDHTFNIPGQTIWMGKRGDNGVTIIEDDVWIGTGAIIMSGVTIGKGSIVAAGAVVTKSIPPCEIWGGILQKKLKIDFLHLSILKDIWTLSKHAFYPNQRLRLLPQHGQRARNGLELVCEPCQTLRTAHHYRRRVPRENRAGSPYPAPR